jgi:hypothetical protein
MGFRVSGLVFIVEDSGSKIHRVPGSRVPLFSKCSSSSRNSRQKCWVRAGKEKTFRVKGLGFRV